MVLQFKHIWISCAWPASTCTDGKVETKNVGRNIILGSQKQSVITFDVDTSQHKHCVTTSDIKAELVAQSLWNHVRCVTRGDISIS